MIPNLTVALVFGVFSPLLPAQDLGTELFEKLIRPILVERCVACHNPAVLEGGLDLTSATGFAKGATTGALLRPEAPERSRLLAAISYEERVKMPPDGRLEPEALDALRAWVEMGAPWRAHAGLGRWRWARSQPLWLHNLDGGRRSQSGVRLRCDR